MYEGWLRLSNEIAMKACADYAHYLNRLEELLNRPKRRGPDMKPDLLGKIEVCEMFFRSRYGAIICPDCNLMRMRALSRKYRRQVSGQWHMRYEKLERDLGER